MHPAAPAAMRTIPHPSDLAAGRNAAKCRVAGQKGEWHTVADLTLELPDYRASDLSDTVRRLYDHAGALTEQLRYVLMHLDSYY